VVIGFGLLVSGLVVILGGVFKLTNPLVAGLVVFLLALSLMPLRNRLQALIDRHFFREQSIYKEINSRSDRN